MLAAALARMEERQIAVIDASRTRASRPVGPSQRLYANGAALVEAPWDPPRMLRELQTIEVAFGRRRQGSRWRGRPLDLDIILWSGGTWLSPELTIPHPLFRQRDFVAGPAAQVAADWRDPVTGFTLRQIAARVS
ncbi:2-amino-4-hydroxy-6-hydroxymethyldihydropteridine pyrophosphokinase [Erythrobacter sp. SD-21]|nr:2-amino-4-hydroxy-6-hydroxymethyldihydropteridine pyrophosphokinase [Erythrobacter sp. SD-21]